MANSVDPDQIANCKTAPSVFAQTFLRDHYSII